jgi:hypothetical protein
MNGENFSQFHRRQNADGTIDSICLRCFLTAASAENETDLHKRETAHQCADKESFMLIDNFRSIGQH